MVAAAACAPHKRAERVLRHVSHVKLTLTSSRHQPRRPEHHHDPAIRACERLDKVGDVGTAHRGILGNVTAMPIVTWTVTIVPIRSLAMTVYQRIHVSRDVATARRAWFVAG